MMADLGTHWIAAYRTGTAHNTAGVVHVRMSDDEGATWSAEDTDLNAAAITGAPFSPHATNTNVGGAVPVACPNGDVILVVGEVGSAVGRYVWRSTDGGSTWADEGRINDDPELLDSNFTVHEGVIYGTFWVEAATRRFDIYTSADNGVTWVFLSTLHEGADANESTIVNTGGSNWMAISRDQVDLLTTYVQFSTDSAQTWGARQSVPDIGIVQMPRLKAFEGGVMLFGREGAIGVTSIYTTVWFSTDGGLNFVRKYRADGTAFNDGAYCDVLQRANGDFYIQTYGGTTETAVVRDAVFRIA